MHALKVDARDGGEAADAEGRAVAEDGVRVDLRGALLQVAEHDEHEAAHERDDREPLERLDATLEQDDRDERSGHHLKLRDGLEGRGVEVSAADVEERVLFSTRMRAIVRDAEVRGVSRSSTHAEWGGGTVMGSSRAPPCVRGATARQDRD